MLLTNSPTNVVTLSQLVDPIDPELSRTKAISLRRQAVGDKGIINMMSL